jgi:hypothetical protein
MANICWFRAIASIGLQQIEMAINALVDSFAGLERQRHLPASRPGEIERRFRVPGFGERLCRQATRLGFGLRASKDQIRGQSLRVR